MRNGGLWPGSVEFDNLLREISTKTVLSNRQLAYVIEIKSAADGVRPAEGINEEENSVPGGLYSRDSLIQRTSTHSSALA